MRRATRWLVCVLVGLGGDRVRELPDPEPVWDELLVAVDGCDGLASGPRCLVLGPGSLRLWLEGERSAAALTVSFDDVPLPADRVKVDVDADGVLVEISAPHAEGTLVLVQEGRRRFVLELVPQRAGYLAARSELELRRETTPVAAVRRELIERSADLEETDAHQLALYDTELAFEAGDWKTIVEAPWRLDETSPADADIAALDRAHVQAAYVAIHVVPDYAQAIAHLEAARAHPLDLGARVNADYLAGVLQQRLGRPAEALEWFHRAARLARRVHLDPVLGAVVAQQAVALAELGRFEEVGALVRDAESRLDAGDALGADILGNLIWAQMLVREDEPSLPDPSPTLRRLVAHHERIGEASRVAGVRLNLAIAASQSEDLGEAARVLETVDRAQLPARDQIFVELVAARVAAAAEQPNVARGHLDRARLLAELGSDEALALRTRLARAELELHSGAVAAARAELEAAEAIEARLAQSIAPAAGRSLFSNARRRGRARHVELLLAQGDREAALCTVLGARARHLRGLAAGADRTGDDDERLALLLRYEQGRAALAQLSESSWELPADELAQLRARADRELEQLDALLSQAVARAEQAPPPWHCRDVRKSRSGQGLLTMHPAAEQAGWWFLLDRDGSIEAQHVPIDESQPDDPEAVAQRALAELDASGHLHELRTLTVVPLGAMVSVDFHALEPLENEDGPRVTYALGLGTRRPPSRDRSVVVIVGAAGNLREPRAEAEQVRAAMVGAGWSSLDAWTPGQEHQPALLHYAGHGHHAGLTGWGSDLELASGVLTSQHVIAHQRAPSVVVLGACEAGMSDARVIDGGMNMASAFLLAGAQLVIAPKSTVADDDARALAGALYRAVPAPGDSRALATALTEALAVTQRSEGRYTDWRAWVP